MEFAMHSAVVLAVTVAGAMPLAAPGSGARDEAALEKGRGNDLAQRDAYKTWGDARLLTSICLATE